MALKARDRSLEDWFVLVAQAAIQLPRFQRFEAWGYSEVADLLQTVLHELPAGSVLVLESAGQPLFKYRPIVNAPLGQSPSELLLDGQQRLTALWRALNDSYHDCTFFVGLRPDEDSIEYPIVRQRRWTRNGQRYPLWVDDPLQVYERGLAPIRILRPGDEGAVDLEQWLDRAIGNVDESDNEEERPEVMRRKFKVLKKRSRASEYLKLLRTRISTFNLPYLHLPFGTAKDTVLDVFIKMNTRLVKLTAFDIIVADVEGETGDSLHDFEATLRGRVPDLQRYGEVPTILLDAVSLMQGRVPNQAGYFGIHWSEALDQWERLIIGSQSAVEILREEHVFDESCLPTRPVLGPLIALCASLPSNPDKLGNARTLLKRYLWHAFFTGRYERSAATFALQDYRALMPAVVEGNAECVAPIFDYPLPSKDEFRLAGWPRRRDRLARAILLASLRGGAIDLADGAYLSAENLSHREYHHIFPRGFLAKSVHELKTVDLALNCMLVTWRTNRTIAASPPLKYLTDRANAASLGEEQLRQRLRSHAVPFEETKSCNYNEFIEKRADIFFHAAHSLADGHDWRPNED